MKTKQIAATIFLFALLISVGAQQPKPEIKLNPEASKAWLDLEQAKRNTETECQKAWGGLQAQQNALLLGAGAQGMACAKGGDGIVSCFRPEPSPSPSPKK